MYSTMRFGRGGCEGNSSAGYVENDPSGRYGRFREILGKGAMKTVYRAFDERFGMEVAWNQVLLNDVLRTPDELERLYSEVHLLKDLNHDSIIRFHTSWIDIDNRTFNFITEMFSSGTLREYRKKYKQVDIRAIKNWARQILHGLVYLHSHDPPVIHRDIKCDNIFVNGHIGQVKIGDLGLAAILRGSRHAHSVIGTPEFMAPELYEEEYDELVDVYSFGMCMLEMLTSEYPYSECSNPAQIYKKVISGKKPEAFYQIQDTEAQEFVAKCLETSSKRLPAQELLLDPFLAVDEVVPVPKPSMQMFSPNGVAVKMPFLMDGPIRSTDMRITGKLNPEDNTVFLKVQITDKHGQVRNVHFLFDTDNDTAMEVATEMVKELHITDWDPCEIAEMIEEEISALVPGSNHWGSSQSSRQHSFNYDEDDDDDDENHPPHLYSGSPYREAQSIHGNSMNPEHDWPQGHVILNEDAISESSYDSYNYSNTSYSSGKDEYFTSNPKPVPKPNNGPTRFNPEDKMKLKFHDHRDKSPNLDKKQNGTNRGKKLGKMRAFMDIRSQLLHRALTQALKRPAKTVGAVENIGFQDPS